MIFRLLTIGASVACVVMLANPRPLHVVMVQPAAPAARRAHAPPLSVVDIAGGASPALAAQQIKLADGEWIAAVNDQRPRNAFEAGAMIVAFAEHGGYLDVTVAHRGGDRRVLVLVH